MAFLFSVSLLVFTLLHAYPLSVAWLHDFFPFFVIFFFLT